MTGPPEDSQRRLARSLAAAAVARGEPLAWFEELYARGEVAAIPWAELAANPNLLAWLDEGQPGLEGCRALKVGSGLGDDAEALSERGFDVVAFDVAPSAVAAAERRFPESSVSYSVADVLDLPAEWAGAFGFVFEAYTLQVLPPGLRPGAATAMCAALAPGGVLLVIARGRDASDPEGEMPWPLTPAELRGLFEQLELESFDDYIDDESPPVRRLRAVFRRPT